MGGVHLPGPSFLPRHLLFRKFTMENFKQRKLSFLVKGPFGGYEIYFLFNYLSAALFKTVFFCRFIHLIFADFSLHTWLIHHKEGWACAFESVRGCFFIVREYYFSVLVTEQEKLCTFISVCSLSFQNWIGKREDLSFIFEFLYVNRVVSVNSIFSCQMHFHMSYMVRPYPTVKPLWQIFASELFAYLHWVMISCKSLSSLMKLK